MNRKALLPEPPVEPADALAACHSRIRMYTEGLRRLCALPSLKDPQVPPAAAQAYRYFSEGLPLHAKDEDLSLGPRLLRIAPHAAPLLDRLASEHRLIDDALELLLPLLQQLSEGEEVEAEALRSASLSLSDVLIPHIELEERELFPLCSQLSPEEKATFGRELIARRQA